VTRCASVSAEPGDPAWLATWQRAGARAGAAIDAELEADVAAGRLTGPWLAREVWDAVVPGEHLVAGSSNPIRDLDLTARPTPGTALPVFAGRGLAGIDGTVSTATGLALAAGPTRVLLGDVTFLHDVGALLAGPDDRRPDLQIVVLNDGGGGIFSLLEYGERAGAGAREAAEFDRLFGTPHTADLGSLCRGYDVPHELVLDPARLRKVLADPPAGTSVLEVRADRSGLRDLHARLRRAAQAAARGDTLP
jgi:2-succinyl-5-enolpyruvyl-6-hydroxy-3-cyclohexene-1-carboxylate synthase